MNRDERFKLVFCSGQEFTLLQRCPAGFRHRFHVVPLDVDCEASVDALIEKHPQEAFAVIRAMPSSRKATTCSRLRHAEAIPSI